MQAIVRQIKDSSQPWNMTGKDYAGYVSLAGLSCVVFAPVAFIFAGPFGFVLAIILSMFGIGLITYAIYLTQSE